MGCHLFSIMINGLLPLQWPDQGVFTSSVLWLLGFTPSVGLNMGLNMGLTPSVGSNMGCTPSVGWIWALPHQWFEYGPNPISGSNMGRTPSVGWIWALPHQWFECGLYLISGLNMGFTPSVWFEYGFYPISGLNMVFTPSVVYLFGLYPIRGLFEGLYPDNVLIHLLGCYPQWRILSVCTAMSGYFLFGPAQSCLNGLTIILSYEFHTCSFIHGYTACIQISFMHSCIVGLILKKCHL